MSKGKIRVSMTSFNSVLVEEACKKILSTVFLTEEANTIKGPIFLPTQKRIYCVLRSPHVDKDSREQFEIRKYKRIIDIYPKSPQTFDAFSRLELPPGVFFQINSN